LYEGEERRIPREIRARLEAEAPFISPIVELELTYLYEVGRVSEPPSAPLTALRQSIGLEVADASVAELVRTAADLSWTRNPFDRLIAAHAILANAPLITADTTIRENLPLATWA
jgi:PIN domain nuclease of toxin-antitoxin system